ncbi:uncharacterized protein LOC119600526 [Lucilia sericata]|uniref:uncharacterized protein LOC119600526 n=1 Tax=Lucilia sericata TaxID=13632 RepID=UPI0018A857A7|nr:uncharacterized protein LOC119600526 [Lucilia sericata]
MEKEEANKKKILRVDEEEAPKHKKNYQWRQRGSGGDLWPIKGILNKDHVGCLGPIKKLMADSERWRIEAELNGFVFDVLLKLKCGSVHKKNFSYNKKIVIGCDANSHRVAEIKRI